MATGIIKTIQVEKAKSFGARITEFGRLLEIARGNGFTLRVNIFEPDGSVSDLSDHATLKVAYMPTTRSGDALAVKTASIEDATFTQEQADAGTHYHAEFTFSEADMNPSLDGGLSKNFWIVVWGLATVGGGEVTHGGGTLTIVEDGTENTASTPAGPDPAVTAADVVTIIAANGESIKTAYEAEADTNAFTDDEKSKLAGVEASATADQTGAEIVAAIDSELASTAWKTQRTEEEIQDIIAAMFSGGTHTDATVTYDDSTGTLDIAVTGGSGGLTQEEVEDVVGILVASGTGINATYDDAGNTLTIALAGEDFTTALKNKLDGIESGATADQTGAEIKAAYEAEADTNAFTDAEKTKLSGIATGAEVNPDAMSQAEAETGTATTERVVTAAVLKAAVLEHSPASTGLQADGSVDGTGRQKLKLLNLGDKVAATIASGAITVTASRMVVTSESGTADSLKTLNGGADGDIVMLYAAAGHTITLDTLVPADHDFSISAPGKVPLSETVGMLFVRENARWRQLDNLDRPPVITVVPYTGGVQTLTTTYADVAGSSITYNRRYADSMIKYSYDLSVAPTAGTGFTHFKFFAAGTEQTAHRNNAVPQANGQIPVTIAGTFDSAASGNIAFKLQARHYGGSAASKLHEASFWDGAASTQDVAAILTIIEIPT